MLHDISHDTPEDSDSDAPAASEQFARREAIKQIEGRRHPGPETAGISVAGLRQRHGNAGAVPGAGLAVQRGEFCAKRKARTDCRTAG